MKPSLQLKLGQQLAMTPQLQQAIRLLQLSTLDLQQEIQEALEANPLLEQDESNDDVPDETSRKITRVTTTSAPAPTTMMIWMRLMRLVSRRCLKTCR